MHNIKDISQFIVNATNLSVEYAEETLSFWVYHLGREQAELFLYELFYEELSYCENCLIPINPKKCQTCYGKYNCRAKVCDMCVDCIVYKNPEYRFYPRRMINNVKRLVELADSTESIKPGKDSLKIIFYQSCIETLQKIKDTKTKKKYLLIIDFFVNYFNNKEKELIVSSFDLNGTNCLCIEDFAWIIMKLRNSALHEGEYWNTCIFNESGSGNLITGLQLSILNNEKQTRNINSINNCEHETSYIISTNLKYSTFKNSFVKACYNFIVKFLRQENCKI